MNELYSHHPAMFKSNPLGFILALILVPVGVGILIFLYWFLMNKSSKLVVTEHSVLFEKGLLSKERSEIDLDGVRTVKVSQSLLNRMFGVGTIELFTSGDKPEIVAKGMPDPNKVREIVKARQAKN